MGIVAELQTAKEAKMEEYKIEKNIPLIKNRYPFNEMEVGDSIKVTGDRKKINSARSSSTLYGKRNNKKFTSRQEHSDPGEMSVRIWRVE